ncbi:hypothetical protein [Spirosoma arboris]|nr:hypothetical protein [Spirosoma arboris]
MTQRDELTTQSIHSFSLGKRMLVSAGMIGRYVVALNALNDQN